VRKGVKKNGMKEMSGMNLMKAIGPMIRTGMKAIGQQATAKLFDYWTALHDSIKWTGDEELERQKELGEFLEQRFGGVCFGSARPMVEDFIKAASGIKGCPGLDQWTYQDLKLVVSCKAAATMIWNAMGLWEELGCTPTVLQHLRLVFIPKDGA